MKLINTKYGVLNTVQGDKIEFAYSRPNYRAIALYGAVIALVAVYAARFMGVV